MPPEDFQDALLAGQPGQAPGLDGREVGGDEVMPRLGSDHPPQAVGHDGHGRAVAQGDQRGGVGPGQEPEHAFDGVLLQLGPRHVVRLDLPSGPAASGGAVVLHGEAHPAVLGRRGEHRLELGRAGLGRLLARLQGLPDGLWRVVGAKESGHVGLGHAGRDDALGAHPRRQGGVLVPGGHGAAGHGPDRLVQPGLLLLHHPESGLDRLPINRNAPGVDPIIHRPEPALGRRELKKLVQERPLHHHVLSAVIVEAAPAVLVVPPDRRSVRLDAPGPAHLKHEPMARRVLFVGQSKGLGAAVQRAGQAHGVGHGHGVQALLGRELRPAEPGDAHAVPERQFEAGAVVRDHRPAVLDMPSQFVWQDLSQGPHLGLGLADGPGQAPGGRVRVLDVWADSPRFQIDNGARFKVDVRVHNPSE